MRAAVLAPLMALAACSAGGGDNKAATQPVNEVAPVAPPPKPIVATSLPDGFTGRWGIGPVDCDLAKAFVAKGLMVVEPSLLRFYESRAKVSSVTIESPQKVVANLSWSGEGMTWESKTPLTLDPDGKALVRLDHETGREIRYDRCSDQSSETQK